MPIVWASSDHKRLYHYALSLGTEGHKSRWAEASEVALTYGLTWGKMEMKNAQTTRSKDPDVLKVGWCNEIEHTKYLTGLSGITRVPLSRSNVQTIGGGSTLCSSPSISSSAASATGTASDHEFQQVAVRQLQKIAQALGCLSCLPDISEKLSIIVGQQKIKQEKGKDQKGRKIHYGDALKLTKKAKHDESKGVLEITSEDDVEEEEDEEEEEEEEEEEAEDEDAEDEDKEDDDPDLLFNEEPKDTAADKTSSTEAFLGEEALADECAKLNDAKAKKAREKSKSTSADKAKIKAAQKLIKDAGKAAEKVAKAAAKKAATAAVRTAKSSSGRTVTSIIQGCGCGG